MIKKLQTLALAALICLGTVAQTFAAESKNPDIVINGKSIEAAAEIQDGELFFPLRSVCEELGFDVQWLETEKAVEVSKPGKKIVLSLSDYKIKVNDHEMFMMGEYKNLDGRTYMREDFFSDNFGVEAIRDKESEKVELKAVTENSIVINTKKQVSETQTLKVTLQYPELQGLDNADVQDKINSLFEKLAADAEKEGHEIEKYIEQNVMAQNLKAETYFDYKIKYNQNGLLSVVFRDYQYSGGAHGNTVQSSYTFNLNTGAEYRLKDLFKDNVDYVSLISDEVKKQFADDYMTVLLSPFDSIKNDQDYYLTNNSLVVYFQLYEYLPYAAGIPEFEIDFPMIKDLMNSELEFLD